MNNLSLIESKVSATASAFAKEPTNLWDLPSIAAVFYPGFTILERLDKSDDGAIFLARDERAKSPGFDSLVKLKVIFEHSQFDRKKLELFYLEARAAAKLSHKNIIKTREAGQIGNLHFCTIEHTPGYESLRELLNLKAWLDTQLATSIALQVAEALDYAHGQGVMHLKLQPESILINAEGKALITGFGLENKDELKWAHQQRAQSMPSFYCSPEQADGQDVDVLSDLYTLGVIFYEMLTDRVPFDHQNSDVVRHKHRTQMPEPPDVFRSGLPAFVSAVVMNLLEKQSLKRLQTPAHLQAVLNRIIQGRETSEASEALGEAGQSIIATDIFSDLKESSDGLNEPLLDIGIDDGIISGPVVYEDRTAVSLTGERFPLRSALSYSEGNEPQVSRDNFAPTEDALILKGKTESDRPRKRERFEPPTITIIEPPLHEAVEQAPVIKNQAKAVASEEKSFAVSRLKAPVRMRSKLFLILLVITVAVLVVALLNPAKVLNRFRANSPAESGTKEGLTDQTQTAEPVSGDVEKKASLDANPSEKTGPVKKRTSSRAQGAKEGTAYRYSREKPATRKIKSNRPARPAKRARSRAH